MPDYTIGWFVWTNKLFEAYWFGNLVEEKEIVDARLSIDTHIYKIGFQPLVSVWLQIKLFRDMPIYGKRAHLFFFLDSWKTWKSIRCRLRRLTKFSYFKRESHKLSKLNTKKKFIGTENVRSYEGLNWCIFSSKAFWRALYSRFRPT